MFGVVDLQQSHLFCDSVSGERLTNEISAVAVFDADSPPALAFVRSLGKQGVPVHVYASSGWNTSRLSRYTARTFRCPDIGNADVFLPWLEKQLRDGIIVSIAPTSDIIMYYIAELFPLFSETVQRAYPSPGAIMASLFKDRFGKICESHHIATPWTLFPRGFDDALFEADKHPYPLIVKPRSHIGVGVSRGWIAHDPKQLTERYCPYNLTRRSAHFFEKHPELRWPMLQEYVPHAMQNLYAVTGILDAGGQEHAVSGCAKIDQWPPTLGVGTIFEPYDNPQLVERGVAAVRKLLDRGLFELELIYDRRKGDYLAIDLNPRAYGQISLNVARGHDLPFLWNQLLQGVPLQEPPQAINDIGWVNTIPFIAGSLVKVLTQRDRKGAWERYRDLAKKKRVDVIHDLRDPLPSLAFASKLLRHPGSLIRPFLEKGNIVNEPDDNGDKPST